MKIEELFKDDVSEMPENVPDTAFSDEIRERIYSRIERKLASQQDGLSDNSSVSGVEKYRKPILTKFIGASVSVAAAAVVVMGSLSFYGSRHNTVNNINPVLNSLDDSDRPAAARMLAEEFDSVSDYLNGGAASDSSVRYFYQYSSRSPEWQGEDVAYYLTDGDRFNSFAEIYDALRETVSDEYFDRLKGSESPYIGTSIDEAFNGNENSSAPVLIEYNGKLYTREGNTDNTAETLSEPQIFDSSSHDFSAYVDKDKEYVFDFVWDGTQWKIDDIRLNSDARKD